MLGVLGNASQKCDNLGPFESQTMSRIISLHPRAATHVRGSPNIHQMTKPCRSSANLNGRTRMNENA
jgi:hypothetical protein